MTTASAAQGTGWRARTAPAVTYQPPFVRHMDVRMERDVTLPFIPPQAPQVPPKPRTPGSKVAGVVLVCVGALWAALVGAAYLTIMAKSVPSLAVGIFAWAVNSAPGLAALIGGLFALATARRTTRRHAREWEQHLAAHNAAVEAARAQHPVQMAQRQARERREVEEYNAALPQMVRDLVDVPLTRELSTRQVHGEAGESLSVGRFGAAARAGAAGERATVTGLQPVLDAFPAARLVNGLRWPGTDHADIDHILLVGSQVAVIDSKQWQAGNYWWDGKELYRDGTKVDHPPKIGAGALALVRHFTWVPDNVRTWVVIHADGPVTVENAFPAKSAVGSQVRLVTLGELVEEVGAWLGASDRADVVERATLAKVLALQVPPAPTSAG